MITGRRYDTRVSDIFSLNISHWETSDLVFKLTYLSLHLVDLVLTVAAAHYGFPELNPFMRASLSSPSQLAIFKFGIPLLISWLVPGKFLIPGIVLLLGIVGWNVKELLLVWS